MRVCNQACTLGGGGEVQKCVMARTLDRSLYGLRSETEEGGSLSSLDPKQSLSVIVYVGRGTLRGQGMRERRMQCLAQMLQSTMHTRPQAGRRNGVVEL